MVVHAFFSLIGEIFGDVEVGMLGRFDDVGVDFEGKSTEISVVDTTTSQDVFSDVLSERSDDEMELGLGVERFDGGVSSGLGGEMFSGVVLGMRNDPE